MIFSFFYEMILWLVALVALPKFLYFNKKYRRSLAARFGMDFPLIEKGNRPLIWMHAVSMGETKAIIALARHLKTTINPILIISSITETGHAEAKRSLAFADYHVFLPFDFSWIMRPLLKRIRPDLVIISETDFWYHFLQAAKRSGAHIALVNGKLSERSTKRLRLFPFFANKLFSLFDIFCVQSTLYQERFLTVGAQNVVVTGNLKFDDEYPMLPDEELSSWKSMLGISDQPVLVIGSTHNPEEQLLIASLRELWEKHPNVKVILVPRHPERFDEVAALLQNEKIPFIRFTKLQRCTGKEQVILLDTMGLLRKCYQIADVALLAGSFTPHVGGHNILEPSWYGIPVIFGPHMHAQPELRDIALKYGAGLQVDLPDLAKTLSHLFDDAGYRASIGNAGRRMMKEIRGATKRTAAALPRLC